MPFEVCHILENFLGPVCYANSNSHFYDLNHFTHISTHFFTHTNFKNYKNLISNYSTKHPLSHLTSYAEPTEAKTYKF